MAKSLIDLIVLYGEAKASGAWAEAKAEERGLAGNGGEEEHLRDQKESDRKAAKFLERIQKMIGIQC